MTSIGQLDLVVLHYKYFSSRAVWKEARIVAKSIFRKNIFYKQNRYSIDSPRITKYNSWIWYIYVSNTLSFVWFVLDILIVQYQIQYLLIQYCYLSQLKLIEILLDNQIKHPPINSLTDSSLVHLAIIEFSFYNKVGNLTGVTSLRLTNNCNGRATGHRNTS